MNEKDRDRQRGGERVCVSRAHMTALISVNSSSTRFFSSCTDEYAHTYDISTKY